MSESIERPLKDQVVDALKQGITPESLDLYKQWVIQELGMVEAPESEVESSVGSERALELELRKLNLLLDAGLLDQVEEQLDDLNYQVGSQRDERYSAQFHELIARFRALASEQQG
jgi:hypothetical protein